MTPANIGTNNSYYKGNDISILKINRICERGFPIKKGVSDFLREFLIPHPSKSAHLKPCTKQTRLRQVSAPFNGRSAMILLYARYDAWLFFRCDEVHTITVSPTSVRPKRQTSRCHMVKCHSDTPKVHIWTEQFIARLPQHSPLVHVWMQIFFGAVQRHKLLIFLEFTSCAKIRQLINWATVFSYVFHYVAGFQIAMDYTVEQRQESGITTM